MRNRVSPARAGAAPWRNQETASFEGIKKEILIIGKRGEMNAQPCGVCSNLTPLTSLSYRQCAYGHWTRPHALRPTCGHFSAIPKQEDLVNPWHLDAAQKEDRPRKKRSYKKSGKYKKVPLAPPEPCHCGCGEMASPGKQFRRGHNPNKWQKPRR
jgi:hypothetical protein